MNFHDNIFEQINNFDIEFVKNSNETIENIDLFGKNNWNLEPLKKKYLL